VSIAIAVASIVFMATQFDFNWSETVESVWTMSLWQYFVAFLLHYSGFVLRAARWKLLVENASRMETNVVRLPSIPRLLQIILISWFVNSVVWLRLGDAYRAYLFSAQAARGFSWSLGTILAERILDITAITVLRCTSNSPTRVGSGQVISTKLLATKMPDNSNDICDVGERQRAQDRLVPGKSVQASNG